MAVGGKAGVGSKLALCALIAAIGCTAVQGESVAVDRVALNGDVLNGDALNGDALGQLTLTHGPTLWSPPDDGADGAPQFEVRWSPGGPVFASRAIAALPWGDAAAVIAADGSLHRFHRDGRDEALADQATTPLASPDGRLLGYASGDPYGPKDVHVVDARGQDRVVAIHVLAPALLSFERDGHELDLVAAGPGGVMGQHVIDLDADAPSIRCLTNCALRTGEDWGDAFVPLPGQGAP